MHRKKTADDKYTGQIITEMSVPGREQGMGPDYRIHTYDKIHEPPAYREYNSSYSYNHIHSYNHVHSYDKVHQYNTVKNYDHVHEWKYREYKTHYRTKTRTKTKPERQWEYVPTKVVYYKDVWPQLYLCYKQPMGPDIRVTDYKYKEYTQSNFRPRHFSFEDIETDCAKYMDQPYKEYKGNVDYKLTKSNYHPFTIYTYQEKRHKTVMKKQYKDEHQNIIDKPGSTDKIAAVIVPTGQPQEKQTVLTPHNTPSPSPTPVEVSSVIIDSPMSTQRDERHNIIPVMAAVPLNKEYVDDDEISAIPEESEVDIDEFEESDIDDKIDSPKPTAIVGAAVIGSNVQEQSPSKEQTPDDGGEDKDDVDDDDDDDESKVPTAAVVGAAAVVTDTNQNTNNEDKIQEAEQEDQQNNDQDAEPDTEDNLDHDVNTAPVVAAAVIASEPVTDTEKPTAEQDTEVEGGTSDVSTNKKSTLPPEVVAAIEAYDVAHSEIKVPDLYSATGTISRTINMMP